MTKQELLKIANDLNQVSKSIFFLAEESGSWVIRCGIKAQLLKLDEIQEAIKKDVCDD